MTNILVAVLASVLSFTAASAPAQSQQAELPKYAVSDFTNLTEQSAFCIGVASGVSNVARMQENEGMAFQMSVMVISFSNFLPQDEYGELLPATDEITFAARSGAQLVNTAVFGGMDTDIQNAAQAVDDCAVLLQEVTSELEGKTGVENPDTALQQMHHFNPEDAIISQI